jgi:two-component system chemotaxis response regulator CheB
VINDDGVVRDLFLFGGSAGGLEAFLEVLKGVPQDFPATIAVTLHRSPVAESQLVDILARHAALPVNEPTDGEPIKAGHVYLAPRDFHLTIEGDRWRLARGLKIHRMRPAVDPLFTSAAAARGSRVVGVLLSGGGIDGVEGLIAITGKGGLSIAQQPEQARQPSMPVNAIREDDVDAVLRLTDIARILPMLAAGHAVEIPRPPARA